MDGVPFTGVQLETQENLRMQHVAYGDVNGDSAIDVVTHSRLTDQLYLLRNNGGLEFEPPQPIGTALGARNVEIFDIDKDGDLDIVTETHVGIVLHENIDGDGTFRDQTIIETQLSVFAFSSFARFTDVDMDDDFDAVIGTPNGVVVFFNQGGLDFSESQRIVGTRDVRAMAVDDMDGDGDEDLILHTWNRDAKVHFYSNQNGVFQLQQSVESGGAFWKIHPGDFDRDGDIDFLLVSPSSSVFWESEGMNYTIHSESNRDFSISLETPVASINGGFEVIGRRHGMTSRFRIQSNFTLRYVGDLDLDDDFASVVDLDNDGDNDIVELHSHHNAIRMLENKDGAFVTKHEVYSAGSVIAPIQPRFIDWDHDGDLDVLVASQVSGEVSLYLFDAQSQTFSGRRAVLSNVPDIYELKTIDFDNDNDYDLLLVQRLKHDVLLVENKDGKFDADDVINVFSPRPAGGTTIRIADIDNDGDEDMVSAMRNSISYRLNNGGQFGEAVVITDAANPEFELVDLNDDGRLDIVTTVARIEFPAWIRQESDGSFSPIMVLAATKVSTEHFVTEDVDGDGIVDPGFVISTQLKRFLWLSRPENESDPWTANEFDFQAPRLFDIHLSDIDLDGDLDLLRSSNGLRWYKQLDNAGEFGPRIAIAGPRLSVSELVVGDYDQDGDVDYLIYSNRDDFMQVLRNETISHVFRGDFNANGMIDAADIDILLEAIRRERQRPEFDIDLNGTVLEDDMSKYLQEIANTSYGDVNLDGIFDFTDLVRLFQNGLFENAEAMASWATGDFDGDQMFTTRDLVLAFQNGRYVP